MKRDLKIVNRKIVDNVENFLKARETLVLKLFPGLSYQQLTVGIKKF